MERLSLSAFVLFFFTATGLPVFAAESVEGRFQIDIVIVDSGNELFERWGHISIVVTDKLQRIGKAFDFGTFNFENPRLLLRYARGFLDFRLSATPYERMIRRYISPGNHFTNPRPHTRTSCGPGQTARSERPA